jgi:hypothetical protein
MGERELNPTRGLSLLFHEGAQRYAWISPPGGEKWPTEIVSDMRGMRGKSESPGEVAGDNSPTEPFWRAAVPCFLCARGRQTICNGTKLLVDTPLYMRIGGSFAPGENAFFLPVVLILRSRVPSRKVTRENRFRHKAAHLSAAERKNDAAHFAFEIWQAGFVNHRIRGAEDYKHHHTYIWENPVKAGLCERPEVFAWSSASLGMELDAPPPGLNRLRKKVE